MNQDQKKRVVETSFRVRFAETDQMGIVHHASYVVYLEEGRSEWSRQAGMPYSSFEEAGFSLAVTELNVRYATPARYDDQITVRTWVEDLASRAITFGYEVVNKHSGQKHIAGTTRHICIDGSGQVRRIPPEWLEHWQARIYEE